MLESICGIDIPKMSRLIYAEKLEWFDNVENLKFVRLK